MIDFGVIKENSTGVVLNDHLGGFSKNFDNEYLNYAQENFVGKKILTEYLFFDNKVMQKYKLLDICFSADLWDRAMKISQFKTYNVHPEINFKNFICSFNGTAHVGRQLLTSILSNQGYFNPKYCTKNFSYNNDWITSHLKNLDLSEDEVRLYEKFFYTSNDFNSTVFSFGHVRFEHDKNIYNLEDKLTQSFLHIISETMSTSYHPFVTEKFIYSIVTRGLFLSYAQPNWHGHIEKYLGYKLYDTIFDYSFDEIQNPVIRLTKLIEMVSKFSKLSFDDWKDLYQLEQDNIEYNYDHYFSGSYLECIKKTHENQL